MLEGNTSLLITGTFTVHTFNLCNKYCKQSSLINLTCCGSGEFPPQFPLLKKSMHFMGFFSSVFKQNHSENCFHSCSSCFLTDSQMSISLSGSFYSSALPDWPIWLQNSLMGLWSRGKGCGAVWIWAFCSISRSYKLQIWFLSSLPNWSSHSSDSTDCCQITWYFTSCSVSSQREATALVPGLIPGWVLSSFLLLWYSNDMQVSNLVRYVMKLITSGCSSPLLGKTPVPFASPYIISMVADNEWFPFNIGSFATKHFRLSLMFL